MLWWLLNFLYKAIRQEPTQAEHLILKLGSFYFLASLTAISVIEPFAGSNRQSASYAFVILGGVVLYLYLVSKIQRTRRMVTIFNGRMAQTGPVISKQLEWVVTAATLALYVCTLLWPEIGNHKVNKWLYFQIASIYDAFLLNVIFGIIGFFFLLQILFQGAAASGILISKLTGTYQEREEQKHQHGQNDFDDFEIVDDEDDDQPEDDNNNPNLLNK